MRISGRIKRKDISPTILKFLKEAKDSYGNAGDKVKVFMVALGLVLGNGKLKSELIKRSKLRAKSTPWKRDERYFNLYICGNYPEQFEFLEPIVKNKKEYPSGALVRILINALLLVLGRDKLKAELIERIEKKDNMLKEYRRKAQREWREKNETRR
jgi:hypothetical protein